MQRELIRILEPLSLGEFLKLFEAINNQAEAIEILKARCATDLELFSKTFFAHYCKRPFNAFHKEIFERFDFGERNVRRATAAPRGNAKSTLKSLIIPLHDVCYGSEKFILLLSSTTPLANKKLKDIRQEVLSNQFLSSTYSLRFPHRKVGESEFLAISEVGSCYFAAVGRGSEVRGIRIGENRPTKIICDDIEHSEEVFNERSRVKTEMWYFEDVTKSADSGTNFEFVGTVLHRDSLLSKLLRNPAYQGACYKAVISWSEREDLWETWRKLYRDIDNPARLHEAEAFYKANEKELLQGTRVLWPEKETYLDHMKDLEEIGRRAFLKEKQNDPQGSEEPVFENLHYYREVPEGFQIESNGHIVPWRELYCIGAMDPSTGQAKASGGKLGDYTVIVTAYKDSKGRVFIHHDWTKRAAPTKYISELFNLNERFKYEQFAVETNLYRNLLLPNIQDERRRREKEKPGKSYRVAFYDVVQTENKRERIYRLEPKANHGWILFNRALSLEFMNQIIDFPHSTHDDAPDCIELVYSLANHKYKASALNLDAFSNV